MGHFNISYSLLWLLAAVVFPSVGLASPPDQVVRLTDSQSGYIIGESVYILEDQSAALTIHDILTPEVDQQFQLSDSDAPNFGFTTSAYWIKIRIKSDTPYRKDWYLELAYPAEDHIVAYIEQEPGEFTEKISGDRVSFDKRDIAYHNFVFKFHTEPEEIKRIYLRVASQGPVQLPLKVWSADGLIEKVNQETFGLGLYYGIMLVVCLYNLFLFLTIRDINYLYYVLYVASYATIQMCFNGLVSEYILPDHPQAANLTLLFSLGSSLVFAGLFTRGFLQSRTTAPVMHNVITGTVIIAALTTIASPFVPYWLSLKVLSALVLIGLPILILGGIRSWAYGYMPARFYVIAWIPLIVGGVLYAMRAFGMTSNSLIATYGSQIGSALEVILLSLALGNRINYERKEKFRAQKQAMHNLKEADELKNAFMSTVSHELKTPVHIILRALDLLGSKKNLTDDDLIALGAAESSAYKMQQLVDDVICFADAQKQQPRVEQQPFYLQKALDETVSYCRNQCFAKHIDFTVRYNDLEHVQYLGDAKKIIKVVCHLLDNSVKFTDEGGIELTFNEAVSASDRGTDRVALRISVSDTGTGIPADMQRKVYDSFRQADGSFTRKYGGMGIGLALCDAYVRTLGGTITFQSNSKGTRFDVILPMKRLAEETSPQQEAPQLPRHPKVLVVEDNPVSQLLLVKQLEKLGYITLKANNGKEALDLFSSHKVDLVLMDCQMPVMDGYEASQRIREQDSVVPIVAVTANTLESDQEKCARAGMNDFVAKPVRKGVIEKILVKWGLPAPDTHLHSTRTA